MIKMIFSFAAVMVLAAITLALPAQAQAFGLDVTVDGIEQVEHVDCETIAPVVDGAAPVAQANEVNAARVAGESAEPTQRITIVDAWQMPHKPSLAEPIASDHATWHLQPCLASRAGFILPSPVEHRIRHRHDGRMVAHESKGKHRHWLTRRLS